MSEINQDSSGESSVEIEIGLHWIGAAISFTTLIVMLFHFAFHVI